MYPRNATSPERIAVGAVVQISDGAVQTSGVSIKVKPQGTTASAGGGTSSYEEGIVAYVPTQAETDYTSFQVIAYKTGCIPVAVTVVTSASATAGYAGTDQSKIANPTSTVNLSGTTIKTATDVETDTADIQSKIGTPAGASVSADVAAVKFDTAAILVDTGTDGVVVAAGSKTGYSLSSSQTFDLTGNITGNLSGSVGSLTTNNDKTGYSLASGGVGSGAIASAELNTIADAILDRNMATGTDSGSTTVRTVRQALRVMRNRVAISAGTATIYKEDDATSSWTAAVTTTAGDPISAVDPAGP